MTGQRPLPILYDKAGNRTKEDDGTTQTAYTYNGLDQLQTATKEKGTAVDEVRQYSYDANGNQTDVKNTKTGQTESYTYDAENRLSKVAVTDKDGKTAVIQQNRYNGDGQRIQKVEGSKTTNYYYQDGVVSYTTDGENSQTSQNLIGTDGNILATQRYGSDHTDYLLYHKDIQGSSTSLVKEDGSADATYRYTDFGETTINGDNKAENEVCYTGGIYDQSTGLYYLNARYYNSEDGRFVTEDTYRGEITKPETAHLYVYCANNPVNYVDPSGHFLVSTAVLVGVGVGGIVGAVAGSYKGRLVAKRLGYKGKKRNLFIATYGIKGAVVGAIIGALAGYGIGVAMGASSSSGLAVKGVNSAIKRVASDQNKVRHIMQSKHAWTKVAKKNQWKYVKPIVKKAMKSGKMKAIGKTKGKEIVYKFAYNYKGKIIEGTCIAKKGVVKLSDAWVKTIGL